MCLIQRRLKPPRSRVVVERKASLNVQKPPPRTLGMPPPIADAIQLTEFELLGAEGSGSFPGVGMILMTLEFTTGPLISIFLSSFLPTLL